MYKCVKFYTIISAFWYHENVSVYNKSIDWFKPTTINRLYFIYQNYLLFGVLKVLLFLQELCLIFYCFPVVFYCLFSEVITLNWTEKLFI